MRFSDLNICYFVHISDLEKPVEEVECLMMCPEDIDYERHATLCYVGYSDRAAEITSALGSASIVFKNKWVYLQKKIHDVKMLYKYA